MLLSLGGLLCRRSFGLSGLFGRHILSLSGFGSCALLGVCCLRSRRGLRLLRLGCLLLRCRLRLRLGLRRLRSRRGLRLLRLGCLLLRCRLRLRLGLRRLRSRRGLRLLRLGCLLLRCRLRLGCRHSLGLGLSCRRRLSLLGID